MNIAVVKPTRRKLDLRNGRVDPCGSLEGLVRSREGGAGAFIAHHVTPVMKEIAEALRKAHETCRMTRSASVSDWNNELDGATTVFGVPALLSGPAASSMTSVPSVAISKRGTGSIALASAAGTSAITVPAASAADDMTG